jgi:hypothetical protein
MLESYRAPCGRLLRVVASSNEHFLQMMDSASDLPQLKAHEWTAVDVISCENVTADIFASIPFKVDFFVIDSDNCEWSAQDMRDALGGEVQFVSPNGEVSADDLARGIEEIHAQRHGRHSDCAPDCTCAA